MVERETGIPCFECGKNSGIYCPGRRLDEATRCFVCFDKYMKKVRFEEELHMKQFESQSQSSQSSAQGSSGGTV